MEDEVKTKKGWSKRLLRHKVFRVRNIFSLISFILTILIIISLYVLNVLPNKYNIFISIILVIINILGIIFINVHKKLPLKIIGYILLVVSVVISIFGSYYILVTNDFLDKTFNRLSDVSTTNYYVVSLKSNHLTKNDIKGDVSVYTSTFNVDNAFIRLNEAFKVNKKSYDDLGLMFDDVKNNKAKFMLIEASSFEIVFSIDNNLNKNDFDIIYEFSLVNKTNNKKNSTNNEKFNIFIGGKDFASLMDFNAIATVNMKTHTILLTSIPRDYYIEIPDGGGVKDKLSFMPAYGYDTNKRAVEKLFGINIDYSVYINTSSLVNIVDYVGGIEYCSDEEFTTSHALVLDTYDDSKGKKLYVPVGCKTYNGIETLTIARERVHVTGGDAKRQMNCQQIMQAIFKKLITPNTVLHYTETLNELKGIYDTDMDKKVISNFSKDYLNNGNKWVIKTQNVSGLDGHDKVHSSEMIDWVTYPYQDTIDSCSAGIKEVLK